MTRCMSSRNKKNFYRYSKCSREVPAGFESDLPIVGGCPTTIIIEHMTLVFNSVLDLYFIK